MHPNPSVGDRFAIFDTKLIIAFDFATLVVLLQVFFLAASSTKSWILLIDLKWLQETAEKLMAFLRITFGGRHCDNRVFGYRLSSVLICVTFSRQVGWYRVLKDDCIGSSLPEC